MHEEQSKYQVCGVKYWNYDELSLAIQNLPTGVQELASLSDITTSTTQSTLVLLHSRVREKDASQGVFLDYLTSQSMTVKGKHTPHARSDSLEELKCFTQKEQHHRHLCIVSRENRVLRVLDGATNTHTFSNVRHTHTEKSRSVKYLNIVIK